jgi:hypothetical protein
MMFVNVHHLNYQPMNPLLKKEKRIYLFKIIYFKSLPLVCFDESPKSSRLFFNIGDDVS